MKSIILTAAAFVLIGVAMSDAENSVSRSFEFRYVTDDSHANGETDFKGDSAVFDTNGRVAFLRAYADFASKWFGDPEMEKEVISDSDVRRALTALKPQPLPQVKRRIRLEQWKTFCYRDGDDERSAESVAIWGKTPGWAVGGGALKASRKAASFTRSIAPQKWRFIARWRIFIPVKTGVTCSFSGSGQTVAGIGVSPSGNLVYRTAGTLAEAGTANVGAWQEWTVEVDLAEGRYNWYVNGVMVADFVPLENGDTGTVETFTVTADTGVALDDVWGQGYAPTDVANVPYTAATFIQETFDVKSSPGLWTEASFDDSSWETDVLPIVHGGERFAGEDLYLRATVRPGGFKRAYLDVETLDPRGEIHVNGRPVAVLENRHPARIDITKFLVPDRDNIIAVHVHSFLATNNMGHSPDDMNIGWFAGRMHLDLTAPQHIEALKIIPESVADPARVMVRVPVTNDTSQSFMGTVEIAAYHWSPTESATPVATVSVPVRLRPWVTTQINEPLFITAPKLWTPDTPNLYRFTATLLDGNGTPVDDEVATSGIRTVRQDGGTFRLNGKPAMLNGAQIMGFRMPYETVAARNRCAPAELLAKELLMVKRMNGNLMRVHVHAWHSPARNINDPRIPEMCDQFGIMLMWGTTAWIRSNECWGVDFEGYPKYMNKVFNHPSIVMWEVSNHPNQFKKYDVSESNDFVTKAYHTVYGNDQSRIVSVTTAIVHMLYGNDAGTLDYQGNPMIPCAEWTAPMITRGNQDAITGYGREWSALRTWPTDYVRSFLSSPDRAYFNFEHEESIGQPNWKFSRGKPWYKLQSYEWSYDEGSIGRKLETDEWRESQAWQAFSAYESMKKQRMLDYDGFSWCCLHGGANSGTYKKPLTDCFFRAKLAFYANAMVFQNVMAGSADVDVVYGPGDSVTPMILNLGDETTVTCEVTVKNAVGDTVDGKVYENITLPVGRTVTKLPPFKPSFAGNGYYAVEYTVR